MGGGFTPRIQLSDSLLPAANEPIRHPRFTRTSPTGPPQVARDVCTSVMTDTTAAAPASGDRIVIRHVLERQLGAGQSFGVQLVGATTDASVALAHAPATLIDGIRGGATLPAALAHTRKELGDVISSSGSRVRTAIGEYVGTQAALPQAVLVGAAGVAESVLRAQGDVAATAIDSAFSVAIVAARGGNLPTALSHERRDVGAQLEAARADLAESVSRAGREIRGGVEVYDQTPVPADA